MSVTEFGLQSLVYNFHNYFFTGYQNKGILMVNMGIRTFARNTRLLHEICNTSSFYHLATMLILAYNIWLSFLIIYDFQATLIKHMTNSSSSF